MGQLNKIHGAVQQFQHALQNINTSPTMMKRLQVMMEKIESSILRFKTAAHTSYDDMVSSMCLLQLPAALAWSRC